MGACEVDLVLAETVFTPRSHNAGKGVSRTPTSSSNQAATEVLIRRLKLTAMIVEDTASVRKLMERLLLKMGFENVVCYENGSKGLDALMAGSVDIVFCDVQMPIMTGPEMATRLRKFEATAQDLAAARPPRQLVVAVTANSAECEECGVNGFDEICAKPLSREDIYRIINRHFLK